MKRTFIVAVILFVFLVPAYPQGSLSGFVTDRETREPLPGATIFFPDLKTGAATDARGFFTVRQLPETRLVVQVSYVGYEAVIQTLDIEKKSTHDFVLAPSPIEAKELVITGSALSSDNSRTSMTVTPIGRDALFEIPSTNLINAIAAVPGVSEISTGGEISKPVIRGLSYNHVVTLNEGIRQEGNQWGDEHGIEVDQFSADRIEVLKGPASLFYGSDAMGGVINILEPIPAMMNTVGGELLTQYSTNNRLTGTSLMVQGNQEGIIWRLRGTYKSAASFRTPVEPVYNSGFDEKNWSGMLGINRKWGFSHLHVSGFNSRIGMIEGERDSITGQFLDAEGNVVTDSRARQRTTELPFQKVGHLKANNLTSLIFGKHQLRTVIGYQSNQRREFEESPDDPALWFDLGTWTYDLRYTVEIAESLELAAGFSGMTQDNLNKGEEFLVPDYHLQDLGGFIYGKKSWAIFTLNAGVRFDHRYIDSRRLILDSLGSPAVSGDTLFPGFVTDFSAITGSVGMTCRLNRHWNFKFNTGRGFRAPNIAELGSNGVHEGTFRYEIGNPGLNPETSFQIDGEVAFSTTKLNLVFNGFYNLIDQYIYYRNENGEQREVDGKSYPVYRYVQGNAVLTGFELELDYHPVEQLHFDNSADYVYAVNRSTGVPLPFIPPLHTTHALKWTFQTGKNSAVRNPFLQAELELHFRQGRVDSFETPTDGYYLLNASAGMNLRVAAQQWTLFLGGKNLTNVKYYDHLSRLKEVGIYNMGINITVGLIIPFGLLK